jgi:hypothetical protein
MLSKSLAPSLLKEAKKVIFLEIGKAFTLIYKLIKSYTIVVRKRPK